MDNSIESAIIREASKLARLRQRRNVKARELRAINAELRTQTRLVKTLKNTSQNRDWQETGAHSKLIPEGTK